MKKLATLGLFMILLGVILMKEETLVELYSKYVLKRNGNITIMKNDYYRDYDFSFVKTTTDFTPTNRQEILNIFYTAINAGQDSFTFYCPKEYKDCLKEVATLAEDQTTLSHINNFVHPYNGFKHIETEYDNLGQVTINIYKSYTKSDIMEIDEKVKSIIETNVSPNATDREKIKMFHDYVINNSKYDSNRSNKGIINYKSDIAYGPLIQNFSICGGYTDAMSLFLEYLGIKNYKVSSDNHVWNAVYLDNNWYHLDLTWDDPVTVDNTDILEYNFFLITTSKLQEIEKEQHIFDLNIYQELQ